MRILFFLGHLTGLIAHHHVHGQVENLMFTCTQGGKEIPIAFLCDGSKDCPQDNYHGHSSKPSEDEDPAVCAQYEVHGRLRNLMFTCTQGDTTIPFEFLCNGVNDCSQDDYYEHSWKPSEDEDPTVCARERQIFKTISLKSETQPNGSVLLSWSWNDPPEKAYLRGYIVKGESAHHSFSATISPAFTGYLLPCLHGWTQYKVSVQPYYASQWEITQTPKGLGRRAEVSFFTNSSEPSAPAGIIVRSAHSDNFVVSVVGPQVWNSEPLGFEVQWAEKGGSVRERKQLALPLGWSLETNELNVTLPLQPGREYNMSARARGKGHAAQGDVLAGAVLSVVVATTPSAPLEVKARVLDYKSAIIRWLAPSPAQYFLVELRNNTDKESNPTSSVQVAGSKVELTTHSLPLLDLIPLKNYTASIKACLITTCSEMVETRFETPRRRLPAPLIEVVKSVGTESISLEWSFYQEGLSFNPEFEIRLYNGGIFRSFRTDNMNLTVTNLTALTTYRVEVRAAFQTPDGLIEAGPPTEAVITTWSSVPLEPVVNVYDVQALSDVAVMSWTFLNSSVEEVQVATREDEWEVCNGATNCKSNVLLESNSSYVTGYLEINALHPQENYTFYIRGCNKHGCGNATTAHVSGRTGDPGEVAALTTKPFKNSSILLTWQPPLNTPSGYVVSWQCDDDELLAKCTTENAAEISDLPLDERLCTFSVSAYNVQRNGEEMMGRTSNLSLSWP